MPRKLNVPEWMKGYLNFDPPKAPVVKKDTASRDTEDKTRESINLNDTEDTNEVKKNATPMDLYANLFTKKAPVKDAPVRPSFKLDPKTITAAAGKIDFTKDLPESVKEGLKTGALTPEVFAEAINHVGRASYASAMEHASVLTDQFVNSITEFDRAGLSNEVKRTLAVSKTTSIEAAKKNPVVKRQLELIANSLQEHNPDADADWIAEQTHNFYMEMAKAINPDAIVDPTQQHSNAGNDSKSDATTITENFDWEKYIKQDGPQQQAA